MQFHPLLPQNSLEGRTGFVFYLSRKEFLISGGIPLHKFVPFKIYSVTGNLIGILKSDGLICLFGNLGLVDPSAEFLSRSFNSL